MKFFWHYPIPFFLITHRFYHKRHRICRKISWVRKIKRERGKDREKEKEREIEKESERERDKRKMIIALIAFSLGGRGRRLIQSL